MCLQRIELQNNRYNTSQNLKVVDGYAIYIK